MTTGNLKLQQEALAAAERGATVLTATGRLARHLLHRHRLSRPASTFRRPGVLSLNSWMRRAWQGLWPQSALAPALSRLGLWQRAADLCPPPPPLAATLLLLSQLDETYEVLVRHGLDPARQSPGPPLAEWRAEVCAHFARLAAESGLLHPAHLPGRLAEAVSSGRLVPPPEVALAAIQAPAPAEEILFAALAQTCRLTRLTPGPPAARLGGGPAPAGQPAPAEGRGRVVCPGVAAGRGRAAPPRDGHRGALGGGLRPRD